MEGRGWGASPGGRAAHGCRGGESVYSQPAGSPRVREAEVAGFSCWNVISHWFGACFHIAISRRMIEWFILCLEKLKFSKQEAGRGYVGLLTGAYLNGA